MHMASLIPSILLPPCCLAPLCVPRECHRISTPCQISQRIAPLMDCEKTNFSAYDREYNELMNIVNNFINGVRSTSISRDPSQLFQLSNSSSRSLIQNLAQDARSKNAAFRSRPGTLLLFSRYSVEDVRQLFVTAICCFRMHGF